MGDVVHEGYLKKKPESGLVRLWKNRYFMLKNNAQMYYFLSKDALFHKGTIDLNALETVESEEGNGSSCFQLHLPRRIYYLQASTPADRDEWIKVLTPYSKGRSLSKSVLKTSTSLLLSSISQMALLNVALPKSYTIKCNATDLDRKDGPFQKSDPFFVLYTHQTTDTHQNPRLYKSEIIAQHLNPSWEAFNLDIEAAGGADGVIRFECYDYDNDGTTDYIGYFEASLSRFATPNAEFQLINPRKKTKLNPFYKCSGNVYVTSVIPNYPKDKEPTSPTNSVSPKLVTDETQTSTSNLEVQSNPAPASSPSPTTASPASSTPTSTASTETPTQTASIETQTTPPPEPRKEAPKATRNLIKQVSSVNGVPGKILDLSRTKNISAEDIQATVQSDSDIQIQIRFDFSKAMDNQLLEWISTQLPALTHVDLHWCDSVSGKGVTALAEHCGELTTVSFGCCSKVSASSVTALVTKCKKLKTLDLSWVWNVNDETIEALSQSLDGLEELTLSGCQHLKDKSLYSLANVKSLKVIDLSRCEKLGAEAVLHLATNLPNLETLILLGIDAVTVKWADDVFHKQFPNIVTGFSM